MDMDLLPNVQGNVQTLRNMWTTKVQEEQQLLKPKPVVYRTQSQLSQKQSIKSETPSPIIMHETISRKGSNVTVEVQKSFNFKPIEKSSSVKDTDDFSSLPPPPPSVVFKDQAQSIAILKQSVAKMFDSEKKKIRFSNVKNNGIHHWHIARHVFRSGLIFGPSRRASDSIIPILMKTHIAQQRCRTDSLDSIINPTPFESLVDYLTYKTNDNNNNNEHVNIPEKKIIIKRTISDSTACIERNKLNATIAQYETIMRYLKNYDKFMATYPASSSTSSKRKSINIEQIINKTEEDIHQSLTTKSSMRNRQTQSLARNAGRTFTDFIMNDLLLTPVCKTPSNEQRRLSTVHAASQTSLSEAIEKTDSVHEEETKQVLNELDTIITNNETMEEVPIAANIEITAVVVVAPPVQQQIIEKKEKPLMQRLFEGKKTAYTPDDLQMESTRIPEELANTFEIAKTKCFFPAENILYSTKMIKIDRRGYKQHVRILCITSERIYIITKKDPYPKEAVLHKDVLGISCTPRRDGFICLHTRETREDRGDWIFLLDHPCEFLTHLFMAFGRNNNNDNYLKIKNKFQHTRRSIATVADDCIIESRPSDIFRIAFEDYEVLAIYSP